jgi:hypothetical protein
MKGGDLESLELAMRVGYLIWSGDYSIRPQIATLSPLKMKSDDGVQLAIGLALDPLRSQVPPPLILLLKVKSRELWWEGHVQGGVRLPFRLSAGVVVEELIANNNQVTTGETLKKREMFTF